MKTSKKTVEAGRKRGRVRGRSCAAGDNYRTHKAQFRMTRRLSAELASLQGLCYAFGKKETLAELFERAAFPAIREYCRGYASKAKEGRAK